MEPDEPLDLTAEVADLLNALDNLEQQATNAAATAAIQEDVAAFNDAAAAAEDEAIQAAFTEAFGEGLVIETETNIFADWGAAEPPLTGTTVTFQQIGNFGAGVNLNEVIAPGEGEITITMTAAENKAVQDLDDLIKEVNTVPLEALHFGEELHRITNSFAEAISEENVDLTIGQNGSPIRIHGPGLNRMINEFATAEIDLLTRLLYKESFNDLLCSIVGMKDEEDGNGNPLCNVIEAKSMIEVMDNPKAAIHLEETLKGFFETDNLDDYMVATIDLSTNVSGELFVPEVLLSVSLGNETIRDTNFVTDRLFSKFGLAEDIVKKQLHELKISHFNPVYHMMSALMVYGHGYVIDIGEKYYTFAFNSKELELKEVPGDFPTAVRNMVDKKSEYLRDPLKVAINTSMSHGVVQVLIHKAITSAVEGALERRLEAQMKLKHEAALSTLQSEMKNMASNSNNLFGWS